MSYLFRFDKHLHRGAYIRPSVVGSHSLRAGMYVTSISEMKIATKNGTRLFITFSRRCFAMEEKARARDTNDASALLSEIEAEFMSAKQAIIRLRKEES